PDPFPARSAMAPQATHPFPYADRPDAGRVLAGALMEYRGRHRGTGGWPEAPWHSWQGTGPVHPR
ncbi:MAG: hypothetical protein ABS909_09400, partial [Arthrobacter sp.]